MKKDYSSGLIKLLVGLLVCVTATILLADASTIGQLSASNENDRAIAAIELGQTKDASAVPSLSSRFDAESSKKVRLYIIQALADIGTADAVTGIEKGLSDSDADIRVKAAQSLERFPQTRSESKLQSRLIDSNEFVRVAAATTLGGEQGKQVLITLSGSQDPKVQSKAILGLSTIHAKGPDVSTAIQNGLTSSNSKVKAASQWAADVLGIEGGGYE